MPSIPTRLVAQLGLLLLVLSLLAWHSQPDGQLHVFFLATPGDAVLIQTPRGGFVLLDGGSDPAALAAALGRQLPFWGRQLQGVVLLTADRQRLPGQVAALQRYEPGFALVAPGARRSAEFSEWQRLLAAYHTPVRVARPGEQIALDGATMQVLAAGDGKGAGLILRLTYGSTSVLFAQASTQTEAQLRLLGAQPPVTLLAYPWQYDPRLPALADLRPAAIVFSDAQPADRPAELTFAERAIGGAVLYHERTHGTIEWVSNGRTTTIISTKSLRLKGTK